MLVFLENMLGMLPVLGVGAFEMASVPLKPGLSGGGSPPDCRRQWRCRSGCSLAEARAS